MGQIGRFDAEIKSLARQSDRQQSGPKREPPEHLKEHDMWTKKKLFEYNVVPIHGFSDNVSCIGRQTIGHRHEASAR